MNGMGTQSKLGTRTSTRARELSVGNGNRDSTCVAYRENMSSFTLRPSTRAQRRELAPKGGSPSRPRGGGGGRKLGKKIGRVGPKRGSSSRSAVTNHLANPLMVGSANNQPMQADPSPSSLQRSPCGVSSDQEPADSTKMALDAMQQIKSASKNHLWYWSEEDKSPECIVSEDRREVCFHPVCSDSAAAIRGSEPLKRNGNYYYWEVTVLDKTYGTSVMFGLCTKEQRLHLSEYCNLIGLDGNGWSLSHKGLIWHNGFHAPYSKHFPENQPVTLGLLYDTMRGELSYLMDGKNLGVAFRGLTDVDSELYPVVGSTARGTRMRLIGSYSGFNNLLERSCFTLIRTSKNDSELLKYLNENRVPQTLQNFIKDIALVCGSQTENITTQKAFQYKWNVADRRANTIC